jgi:hypothetical protein
MVPHAYGSTFLGGGNRRRFETSWGKVGMRVQLKKKKKEL